MTIKPMNPLLVARLGDARFTMRQQARLLRRARRLYIAVVAKHVTSTESLNRVAQRMIDAGFRAPGTPNRDARWTVLRMMWKRETGGRDWFGWMRLNGWDFHSRSKVAA